MIRSGDTPGVVPLILAILWIIGLPTFLLVADTLVHVPVVNAQRVAFALAAAPFGFALLRRPRSLQRPGRVEAAMAVYLALILVSWAGTVADKDVSGWKADADFLLTSFLMPFTAFVIARNAPWTEARITAFLWALVAGVGGFLLLYGAAQYTYDWGALLPKALKQMHPDRAQGPFENAVIYGVVVSILIALALFLYLRARERWMRIVVVVMALGLLQSIVACKTRAVWIGLPIALLLPAIRYPRVRWLVALMIAVLAAQVVVAPRLGMDFWGLRERLTQVQQVYDRVAVSATASNMIEHRPLFGFGFGMLTFNAEKSAYYASWAGVSPQSAVFPNNPHNDFVNVVVMMGVLGLLAYGALVGTSWLALWRRQARCPSPDAFVAQLATCVQSIFLIVIINGLFHSVMHMAAVQVLFFFLFGMVVRGPADTAGSAGHVPHLAEHDAAIQLADGQG